MNWLDKLERKLGRHALPHIMLLLTGVMLAVFVSDLILGGRVSDALYFDRTLILSGQVWRLITFIALPPSSSLVWILFSLYFYCFMGEQLENAWGSFRFNVFYLAGYLAAVISGLITGYTTNEFLNMSLFFAFAALFPDQQLLLFFFLPIKVKYLALLDLLYYVWSFIRGSWSIRLTILFAFLNIVLFFGGDFLRTVKQQAGYWKTRREFRKNNKNW